MSTVRDLLTAGCRALLLAEVDTPALDATVLLAHALGVTKERLLAALPEPAPADVEARYRGLLDERCAGRPVSYIRRRKEFWGLEFLVDERVLVPRPDTETLVERALELATSEARLVRIHDACTGCGCVAIALAHELPGRSVSASDLSPDAGRVFADNCVRLLGRTLAFTVSDLLAAAAGPFDLLTANPPYLSDREVDDLAKMGWPEPDLALRGGPDGTLLSERLIAEASARLAPGGWLCLEASPGQFGKLRAVMDREGFRHIDVARDLGGRERVISGQR